MLPDYALEEALVVTEPDVIKAMFHPLRGTLLDLVLERAATVGELATAVGRPPSSVAYHVAVLVRTGLFRVVRTRRVRAVEERLYGRTARVFRVGQIEPAHVESITNLLVDAAAESGPAHRADQLRAVHRHARIPAEDVTELWEQVVQLVQTFSGKPRGGETTYAFVAGLYPTDYPTLPPSA